MGNIHDDDGFVAKYWICDECARERKWGFPKWPVTVLAGDKCGYCKDGVKKKLTPIVDFDRPGKPAEWD